MKRVFIIFPLAFIIVFAISPSKLFQEINSKESKNINKNIKRSKKNLTKTINQQGLMNKKLANIAKSIEKLQREIYSLNKKLVQLSLERSKNVNEYKKAKKELKILEERIKNVDDEINNKTQKFYYIISHQMGIVVAKNMMDDKTPQSIMLQEIYKKYKKHNQQHLLSLTKQIEDLKENREELLKNKIKYQQIISTIDTKKRQYKKELLAKKRLLKELSKKEKKYKEELKRLFKRQSILRKTLAKLKILKMEKENSFREKAKEIEKRSLILKKLRKEREKKQINALKKGKDVKFEFVSLRNIKVFDSSYRSNVDKIYKYRGPKTISPLPGGKIIRRFGTYYDKLYNMKIFSPSIVIKAPKENSIVRNVLNGKVVLTGKNSMFGKFVIVEHNNGIYTIYSGLSKISPYVSNGKFVKKGAVLGKVRRKLHFQAYKDAKPLNPTKLIDI